MKRWIKRTLIGATSAALLLGGLAACVGPGHRGWSDEHAAEMRHKIVARISDKLELGTEQESKLEHLADAIILQHNAVRGNTQPRAELQAIIAGEKFDRVRAEALVTQKIAAVQDNAPEVLTALADFYDSLTPAQQQQVRDKLEQRRKGWGRPG
ncbi:MAG: Spy/CpxP family protein refolding chaperone [Pigmentiphaga sp.]